MFCSFSVTAAIYSTQHYVQCNMFHEPSNVKSCHLKWWLFFCPKIFCEFPNFLNFKVYSFKFSLENILHNMHIPHCDHTTLYSSNFLNYSGEIHHFNLIEKSTEKTLTHPFNSERIIPLRSHSIYDFIHFRLQYFPR